MNCSLATEADLNQKCTLATEEFARKSNYAVNFFRIAPQSDLTQFRWFIGWALCNVYYYYLLL